MIGHQYLSRGCHDFLSTRTLEKILWTKIFNFVVCLFYLLIECSFLLWTIPSKKKKPLYNYQLKIINWTIFMSSFHDLVLKLFPIGNAVPKDCKWKLQSSMNHWPWHMSEKFLRFKEVLYKHNFYGLCFGCPMELV